MKKLILSCALISIASTISFAQTTKPVNAASQGVRQKGGATAEQLAERQAKVFEKQLGLNAEQYKAVYAAELGYQQQDQAARLNGQEPGPGQAMQMKMGRDQQIQATLNAEQWDKYVKMRPATTPTGAPTSVPVPVGASKH